jgi:hypothetical protein
VIQPPPGNQKCLSDDVVDALGRGATSNIGQDGCVVRSKQRFKALFGKRILTTISLPGHHLSIAAELPNLARP